MQKAEAKWRKHENMENNHYKVLKLIVKNVDEPSQSRILKMIN